MSPVVEASSPSRSDEGRLRTIDHTVRAATGHEAFPEALWTAILDPARDAILAISHNGAAATVAYRSDSFTPAHAQVTIGAAPGTAITAIAETIDAIVRARGEHDRLVAWVPGSDPNVVDALTATGEFTIDRQQYQLRVRLPLPDEVRWPDGITVGPFVPGRDETPWLRVNNRAFANHPEQGGWIAEVLERRQAEAWFDPAGFLMAWRGDELVGFCWTKVHTEPELLGEIFVIGVDPAAQGLGLGRALVVGGLDHLARHAGCTTGILYVAADNTPAVALYRSLGFSTARTDTALIREPRDRR